jgi:hypothetical protein
MIKNFIDRVLAFLSGLLISFRFSKLPEPPYPHGSGDREHLDEGVLKPQQEEKPERPVFTPPSLYCRACGEKGSEVGDPDGAETEITSYCYNQGCELYDVEIRPDASYRRSLARHHLDLAERGRNIFWASLWDLFDTNPCTVEHHVFTADFHDADTDCNCDLCQEWKSHCLACDIAQGDYDHYDAAWEDSHIYPESISIEHVYFDPDTGEEVVVYAVD